MARVILHVDMDAFFASVEQRDHPEYRGLPLVVGSPPDQRGVICAASYEARAFKVRSAMPSRTAYKLCPQAIFVRPRMEAYRFESKQIMAIFRQYTSLVEAISVDEAYLDLSERFSHIDDPDTALRTAEAIARQIKERIWKERELTSSIGIASNKFLAKLGSDFNKPNGLTTILEADKVEFLKPLSIRAIHGIGPVTASRLEAQGLKTIEDLQRYEDRIDTVVGSFASDLKNRAWGIDHRLVDPSEDRKSISSEHTFLIDTDHRPELRRVLKELAEDVERQLEKHELGALTLQVKVRYSDFTTLTRQLRVQDPLTDAKELYRLACHLLARHQLVKSPLRLLGLGVSTLTDPVAAQLKLGIE